MFIFCLACKILFFQNSLKNGSINIERVIKDLSEYVLSFEDVVLLKKYCSSFLLALVANKILLKPVFSNDNYDLCTDLEKTCHLENSIVLSLVSDHPDILQ